ncbi:MAG: helix-hairpin-helix domain-containing protein [Myxococcota bacterium]|jgi:competence protein ComEA|nr:helix-hairpin-helix domain-containing protein [Myxococcota bacterium]
MQSKNAAHRLGRSGATRRAAALTAALVVALATIPTVTFAADSTTHAARMTGVVNLNTADLEQLQLLPGVGEKRAAAILEVRKSKGGFKAVEELVEVKGVGDKMLERLRPHLALKGKTTAKRL